MGTSVRGNPKDVVAGHLRGSEPSNSMPEGGPPVVPPFIGASPTAGPSVVVGPTSEADPRNPAPPVKALALDPFAVADFTTGPPGMVEMASREGTIVGLRGEATLSRPTSDVVPSARFPCTCAVRRSAS
ncbi:hypothetical protein ZWY2020_050950 [Hordeum vulgare]|nr:hypothetical protein ZWY2020_025305 [Hordeum vulgare]KAI4977140.1 hypothetical protein ZWY2020_050950 [Hordeum vulgare]